MPATATRERPILFSGPMVMAIIAGTKTQTRRVMKPQPSSECHSSDFRVECYCPAVDDRDGTLTDGPEIFGAYTEDEGWPCPFGGAGDRLWVREAFRYSGGGNRLRVVYRADGALSPWHKHSGPIANTLWRPSIHMPRWASRITLEITDVRVQRVQEISHDDAVAEGAEYMPAANLRDERLTVAQIVFAGLWDSINAKRGFGWEANPFCWAITFRRVEDER